jgi:hypothetical protein
MPTHKGAADTPAEHATPVLGEVSTTYSSGGKRKAVLDRCLRVQVRGVVLLLSRGANRRLSLARFGGRRRLERGAGNFFTLIVQ